MTPDRLPTVTEHRIAKLIASVLGGTGILLLIAFVWRGLRLYPHLHDGTKISLLDFANAYLAIGILAVPLVITNGWFVDWFLWALTNEPAKPAERFDEED